MSDNPPPEPAPPAEAGISNTVTNFSGGVNLDVQRDVNIVGDVVDRNKATSINTSGGAHVVAVIRDWRRGS